SGAKNFAIAASATCTLTRARFAIPGIAPQTRPRRSAIARNVIQTTRVSLSSHQIVDSVMELKSFVKVMDTNGHILPFQKQSQELSVCAPVELLFLNFRRGEFKVAGVLSRTTNSGRFHD